MLRQTLTLKDDSRSIFNMQLDSIWSIHIYHSQIWDAVGGILKGVFKGIAEADITAVCLDDRQVKALTSTNS